ncbi:hypothetical protein SAMN05216436_111141 [bacterium A37T11]|nr:hypothetical protein SAMN05216436_111141 [bacterium A37T11]
MLLKRITSAYLTFNKLKQKLKLVTTKHSLVEYA